MSTGSLGQGLSPGIGMALGARLKGLDSHAWVILGDGEIQEGQIWEAAFVASRYRLANLTAIVDYNGLPQFGWPDAAGYTRDIPIDDPGGKFRAFGWNVIENIAPAPIIWPKLVVAISSGRPNPSTPKGMMVPSLLLELRIYLSLLIIH